jgi:Phosphoesterase family
MVGKTDRANHLYHLSWFWTAARAGHLPAVSLLKAPAYQNGHSGNSDPLDEQVFLVTVLNFLQQLPEWRHMAVIIAWDEAPSMRPAVLEAGGIADITGRSLREGDTTSRSSRAGPTWGRCKEARSSASRHRSIRRSPRA